MTEVFINGQLIDSIETDIALTLSSFKLDSLGTRKGSYSNIFELPKTNANKLLFENSELVTSVTSIPYQRNTCQIFQDGVLLVDGSAIIRETKDNYKVFISAGNSDFFKAIASIKLIDVNLSEYDHQYTLQNVAERRESREGFVYPNIDYGFWEFISLNDWNTTTILNRQQYFQPSFWCKTIIEKAIQGIGYTLNGDLNESVSYQNSVVLCKGVKDDLQDSLAKYRHNIDYGQLTNQGSEKINFPERIEDRSLLYKNDNLAGQFVYFPNIADKDLVGFDIQFTGKVTTNTPRPFSHGFVFVDCLIYNESGTVLLTMTNFVRFDNLFGGLFNTYRAPSGNVMSKDMFFRFPSNRTDQEAFANLIASTSDLTTLRIGWQLRTDKDQASAGLPRLKFENLEFSINQPVRLGRSIASLLTTVRAQNVLPQSETVGDLLITLANLEGVIFQVDESTKQVRTSRIDRLIENKGDALDWSNKLDLTEEVEVMYSIDNFAQENLYSFAIDDKDRFLDPLTGQGSINIANANIESERTVFESKFSTVPISGTFNGDLFFGRVFTGEKYSFDGFNYTLIEPLNIEDFKPRLAILSESESVLDVSVGLPTDINFNVIPLALDFERAINDNYKLIRSVLVNTKVIKALFLLDLEDITNLDFTRPVFVDYFGEYFYIESINQFKVNKRESCFVTLVRI
jgi:hypothetical protein